MTESNSSPIGDPSRDTASRPSSGGLRQLREAQGIELEALAATIKVSAAKLEALESGRYQDLPDAAFTRALAMTVCRALKVDPAPVLAGLPAAQPVNLAASEPRQVPFKPTRARLNLDVPAALPWRDVLSVRWLAPAGVLLAAAAVYFWPQDVQWVTWSAPAPMAAASVAAAASADADAGTPLAAASAVAAEPLVPEPSAASGASQADMAASASDSGAFAAVAAPGGVGALAVPQAAAASAASVPVATPVAGGGRSGSALVLVSTASSWVEVRDANGAKLLSRHVSPGETIGVDGAAPMSVKIGNAAGIQLTYQGSPIELAAFTRNNVARLELK